MSPLDSRAPRKGGRRSILSWIAVVAALAGAVAVVAAVRGQQAAPTAPASAAGTINSPGASSSGTGTGGTQDPTDIQVGRAKQHPLPVSPPRHIDIAAIGVHSAVISVGKNPDGTLEVPQPGPDLDKAAWYEHSVTPGRPGPSVIIGHIDTTAGPSVFFRLADLRPGDEVAVTREDGIAVTYTVDGVRNYPDKSDFPTALVYGGDLSHPGLRLVTCSNFDSETGHYLGNSVVFAHLTDIHKPKT
ncbi:MAG: class F sortase [Nocardioidaceae bacterium]